VDRRVEITGPVDRKMVINALNSGATQFMADFEGEGQYTCSSTQHSHSAGPLCNTASSKQARTMQHMLCDCQSHVPIEAIYDVACWRIYAS
jgi:hypothetical protein